MHNNNSNNESWYKTIYTETMQKIDIRIIKEKKSCQGSLWFLTLNTTPFQLVKIGAKNFGTGFQNTYFGWFGWFLAGLLWFVGGLAGLLWFVGGLAGLLWFLGG